MRIFDKKRIFWLFSNGSNVQLDISRIELRLFGLLFHLRNVGKLVSNPWLVTSGYWRTSATWSEDDARTYTVHNGTLTFSLRIVCTHVDRSQRSLPNRMRTSMLMIIDKSDRIYLFELQWAHKVDLVLFTARLGECHSRLCEETIFYYAKSWSVIFGEKWIC